MDEFEACKKLKDPSMICNLFFTFVLKNRTLLYSTYTSKNGNKSQQSSAYKRVTSKHKRQTKLRNLLTILFAISYCSLTGQSFELSGLFTTTEINDFKNTFGYDLGYNFKNFNKNRISINFSHCIKNASYDDIKVDESSHGPQFPEYYFYKVNSDNQRFGFHFSFYHSLIDNDFSKLGIGSKLSYYYFIFHKETELTYYRPFPDNFIQQTESKSIFDRKNKIGLDLFIEFEINSVVSERLNLFSRINTGLITYGTFAHEMGGWDYPWLTKWLTINLGLRYDFKHE